MEGLNKRLAAQIAAQLPEDLHEALRVLSMAREVILCLEGGAARQQGDASRPFESGPTSPATLRVVGKEGPPYHPDKSSRA